MGLIDSASMQMLQKTPSKRLLEEHLDLGQNMSQVSLHRSKSPRNINRLAILENLSENFDSDIFEPREANWRKK